MGTLTQGTPYVVDYISTSDKKYVLKVAASLENQSRHPIANALIRELKKEKIDLLKINSIKTESGRGITGTLKDIEGEVKVGNLKWLQNNGVKIIDTTQKLSLIHI